MNDFESRIAALFNEQVDHELASHMSSGGPQRRSGGRRPRPRWFPLLAAACVAAVAAGTYGTSQLLSSPAPPARSPIVPGPTPTAAPSIVPSTTSPAPATSATATSTASASRTHTRSASSSPSHPDRSTSRPAARSTQRRSSAGLPATAHVIVRPVRAGGVPAPGWSVRDETDELDPVNCTQGPSPVAVDDDIRYCGSPATNTAACWRAADGAHVLCVSDPYGHTLRRLRLSGAFPAVTATAHPVPQALTIDNGARYLVRNGGAWSEVRQHPSWIGYYTQRATYASDVFGPQGGTGIDTASSRWSVDVFAGDGTGVGHRHRVVTAYELGTAP